MKNKKIVANVIRRLSLPAVAAVVLILVTSAWCGAVTRAEMTSELFSALGYEAARDLRLPPDVPAGHAFARQIGSAAAYGLIPRTEPFSPDDVVDRHGAVRLSLMMMGWGLEASIYESLATLPDLGGSGDSVFFLAAEMRPPAPSNILLDGFMPLSDGGKKSLLQWVRNCKKFVQWNRVFSYGGTDLIIYRQGTARPGEPNEPRTGNPVGSALCEPLYVAAIAVHPDAADTRIAFAEPIGMGRIPPSDFFAAYEPTGVINGGFFAGARPLGTMLLDGAHAGPPLQGRSAIGWNNSDGTFVFGRGDARIGMRTPLGYVEFTKFNSPPPADEAALYTSDVARNSPGIGLDSLQLVVKDGVVTERREASAGDFRIPEGSRMIVARGRSRASLENMKPQDAVDIVTEWETRSFENCTNLIQAGPMLVKENKFITDTETFKDDVLLKRHPRTIMGTDGKRLIWAVIDGRSSIHSRGATMEETRWIAKSLGLTTALNMDGGGSSQLIWRGVMMNSPSDGKERPLPYVVMMMPRGTLLTRRNIYQDANLDQGEFGVYGNTARVDGLAEYMDTYDPSKDTSN